jgi:hypothetical protein
MASKRGGKRRGAGRPSLAAEERLEATVLLRLTAAERRDLRRIAEAAGTTVGVYCRSVVRRHLKAKQLK